MNSKDFTRENGMPPPESDAPWTAGGVVLAVMATAVLMALGSALNAYDEGKNAELQALADAERQALAQQPATVAQVQAAYEAGLTDALAAVKTKPQGVALAQACLALGVVDGGLRGVAP